MDLEELWIIWLDKHIDGEVKNIKAAYIAVFFYIK